MGTCNLAILGEVDSIWSTSERKVPPYPVPYSRSHEYSWTVFPNTPHKNHPFIIRWYTKSILATWTHSGRRALHLLINQYWKIYGKYRMRGWILRTKKNFTPVKKQKFYFCVAYSRIFLPLYIGWSTTRIIYFILSCLRVRMSYHRFNSLSELINRDLAEKIGLGILSKDLMER